MPPITLGWSACNSWWTGRTSAPRTVVSLQRELEHHTACERLAYAAARARDAAGNTTTSSPITVTVANTQTAGLTAAYAFDETSGTTAADASGHAIVGTLINGADLDDRKVRQCAQSRRRQ